jgi:hypothetical protein
MSTLERSADGLRPFMTQIDKPLVYEKGWGKKLTYVIATSKDEIQGDRFRQIRLNISNTVTRLGEFSPYWTITYFGQLF